ncbi:MAG: hypothetical protein EOO30_01170 [Comamonadaceae bacterium]|nr:MAG: hypothetical protein EOO30_01170 [Comamonadaceae bacterium]
MPARTLRCLATGASALVVAAAAASEPPPSCELPAAGADPLADRAGILAQYERLPRPCLAAIFDACTQAAGTTLLDFSSAAVCSFGYEALLKQGFDGNFSALLAWWRNQRSEPTE